MWTRFMDMHSGGGCKEKPYEFIYIEAGEAEARRIFYARFGHNPDRVTCTCCGNDYSISESETLESASGWDRGCHYDEEKKNYVDKPSSGRQYNKYCTLAEYTERKDVLIIRDSEIKPEERIVEVPEQGYVWVN